MYPLFLTKAEPFSLKDAIPLKPSLYEEAISLASAKEHPKEFDIALADPPNCCELN